MSDTRVSADTPELIAYIAECQRRHDDYMLRMGYKSWQNGGPHTVTVFRADVGPRYVRIVAEEQYRDGQKGGSVSGFVDREQGNIYYPAGYKGPQKNRVRGNIFDFENAIKWLSPRGHVATVTR